MVKSFGDIRAVDGISLTIEPGIIYGLLGPNGAGKTTLIRVLTTLLTPDSGRARVLGVDVSAHPAAVRTLIGLAGQNAAVDEILTGFENLVMIGRLYNLKAVEARRRAGEVLERIHLTDAADRQVRTYSGGMRRRLDLAASLVGRPKMLFLDEPTTGVDPRSRHDLWALIHELVGEGTTVLLTTQYLEEADRLCRRIGVIDHGHLISEGTGDELKSNIGGEYIELHVSGDDANVSAQVLQSVTGHEPITDQDTGAVLVAAPDGILNLMEVVRRLGEAGIHPNDISLRRPTLDEVFLTLTGHAVEASVPKPSRRRQGARTS